MSKIFLITYTPDAYFDKSIFHSYIVSLSPVYITDWWHYIDTTYIVASNLDVTSLYNIIYPGVPKRNLLVIEVDPNNAQGWLPNDAWKWLLKYQRRSR